MFSVWLNPHFTFLDLLGDGDNVLEDFLMKKLLVKTSFKTKKSLERTFNLILSVLTFFTVSLHVVVKKHE